MRGTISRDNRSYRQGVVLGLTMAEVLLLLVFCLLIAAAALFAREQRTNHEIRNERSRLQQENTALRNDLLATERLLDTMRQQAPGGKPIEDTWRELIASRDMVRKMEKDGLRAADAVSGAKLFSGLRPLVTEGLTSNEVMKAVRLVQSRGTPDRSTGKHDWPPIIRLSESDGFFFPTGRADISPQFYDQLRTVVVSRLLQIIQEYDVDTIEVIGHTDEQPLAPRPSNLDEAALNVVKGNTAISALTPADNAGLGLARAISVMKVLAADERLRRFTILPYSAAQLIDTNGTLTRGTGASDNRERRRIEIRMRRSSATE